jgi:hypothetical protein
MEIRNFINPDQAMRQLAVDEMNLNDSFVKQAGHFSFYAAKHAQAERQEHRAKFNIEIQEATIDKELRQEARANKEKITETQITRLITLRPEYQDALNDHIEAKQISNVCKSVAESFRQKRDMLIQLGADQREEKKGAPRILESVGDRARKVIGSKTNESDGNL